MGLTELEIVLIELGIGLIKLEIGLIKLGMDSIELRIWLRLDSLEHTAWDGFKKR